MENLIDKMTSSTYKILKLMYDCQVTLPNGTVYVPVAQAELARILGVSTITMNKKFKQFQENDLVTLYENKRGKYRLTEKALIIIKNMEHMEDELREAE